MLQEGLPKWESARQPMPSMSNSNCQPNPGTSTCSVVRVSVTTVAPLSTTMSANTEPSCGATVIATGAPGTTAKALADVCPPMSPGCDCGAAGHKHAPELAGAMVRRPKTPERQRCFAPATCIAKNGDGQPTHKLPQTPAACTMTCHGNCGPRPPTSKRTGTHNACPRRRDVHTSMFSAGAHPEQQPGRATYRRRE